MHYSAAFYLAAACLLQITIVNGFCDYFSDTLIPIGNQDDRLTCSVDPTDSSYLQILSIADVSASNPCGENTAVLADMGLVYEGLDNVQSTLSTTLYLTAGQPTITVDYDVAMTAIAEGSAVTVYQQNSDVTTPNDLYPDQPYSWIYTQIQIQSIFYTVATTTVTATFTTDITTTTTTTESDTTTLPEPTVSVPCTTGTRTITARAETITLTSTVTPRPQTVHLVEVLTITTKLSCLPNLPTAGHNKRRQLATTNYELPNCGSVTPTTYTTSTSVSVSTLIETDTDTAVATSTTTLTVTPTTTATQCVNVKATTTVTPTVTKHTVTQAKRLTVTDVTTIEIIETILPKKVQVCSHNRPPPPVHTHTSLLPYAKH